MDFFQYMVPLKCKNSTFLTAHVLFRKIVLLISQKNAIPGTPVSARARKGTHPLRDGTPHR